MPRLVLAAFEEPRKQKHQTKNEPDEQGDSEVAQTQTVVDEAAEQDSAAATGCTSWASKDRTHDNDRTVSCH